MPTSPSRDEIVDSLREQGFMIRLTEWYEGWQAGAFHRRHPARFGAVSPWLPTEIEAWLALDAALGPVREALAAEEVHG